MHYTYVGIGSVSHQFNGSQVVYVNSYRRPVAVSFKGETKIAVVLGAGVMSMLSQRMGFNLGFGLDVMQGGRTGIPFIKDYAAIFDLQCSVTIVL